MKTVAINVSHPNENQAKSIMQLTLTQFKKLHINVEDKDGMMSDIIGNLNTQYQKILNSNQSDDIVLSDKASFLIDNQINKVKAAFIEYNHGASKNLLFFNFCDNGPSLTLGPAMDVMRLDTCSNLIADKNIELKQYTNNSVSEYHAQVIVQLTLDQFGKSDEIRSNIVENAANAEASMQTIVEGLKDSYDRVLSSQPANDYASPSIAENFEKLPDDAWRIQGYLGVEGYCKMVLILDAQTKKAKAAFADYNGQILFFDFNKATVDVALQQGNLDEFLTSKLLPYTIEADPRILNPEEYQLVPGTPVNFSAYCEIDNLETGYNSKDGSMFNAMIPDGPSSFSSSSSSSSSSYTSNTKPTKDDRRRATFEALVPSPPPSPPASPMQLSQQNLTSTSPTFDITLDTTPLITSGQSKSKLPGKLPLLEIPSTSSPSSSSSSSSSAPTPPPPFDPYAAASAPTESFILKMQENPPNGKNTQDLYPPIDNNNSDAISYPSPSSSSSSSSSPAPTPPPPFDPYAAASAPTESFILKMQENPPNDNNTQDSYPLIDNGNSDEEEPIDIRANTTSEEQQAILEEIQQQNRQNNNSGTGSNTPNTQGGRQPQLRQQPQNNGLLATLFSPLFTNCVCGGPRPGKQRQTQEEKQPMVQHSL